MKSKFDPRIQLVAIMVAMTLAILYRDWRVYLLLTGYLLIQMTLVRAIAAQLRKVAWVMLGVAAFTMLLHLLFGAGNGHQLFALSFIKITSGKLSDGLLYSWRVVILFGVAAWLLAVIERDRLADVLDWILQPLTNVGIRMGGLTMSLRIALRTIPYLQSEHRRIMMAQQARGAIFGGSLFKRVSRQSQIMVPLLASTLRRGDRLGDALQVRHWRNDVTPTRIHQFETGRLDLLQLMLAAFLILATVVVT